MSVSSFSLGFGIGGHEPVLKSVTTGIEKVLEFNSTRKEEYIERAISEIQSTISSMKTSEMLEDSEIERLYQQRELYLNRRNNIINNIFKRLFFRKDFKNLDSKLEEIDYRIYFIESSQTRKLIRSAEQKLIESSNFLAEMKKKYDC